MATLCETVHNALNDVPRTRNQLATETGLTQAAVSNSLWLLRNRGLAERTPHDGWIASAPRIDGSVTLPRAVVAEMLLAVERFRDILEPLGR